MPNGDPSPDRRSRKNCWGLGACLKIPRDAVFAQRAGWRGATKENTPCGSSTEEQRSQTALCAKTLRVAGHLSWSGVGLIGTARFGDASSSPPWPKPKFFVTAPLAIFRQALNRIHAEENNPNPLREAADAEERGL